MFARTAESRPFRRGSRIIALLIVALLLPAGGCRKAEESSNAATQPADVQAKLDRLRALPYVGFVEGTESDQREGVIYRDPQRSCPGYNLLTILQKSRADLIDEEGNLVHTWSYQPSREWGHCELLPSGDLLIMGVDPPKEPLPWFADTERYLMRLNWAGEVLWKYNLTAHHDIERTPRGQLLTLAFQRRLITDVHPQILTRDDRLMLLEDDGRPIDNLSLYDALTAAPGLFTFQRVEPWQVGREMWVDLFHTNSVEWIHYRHLIGRHAIYDPSNVLVCFRHQDAVAVVNFDTKQLIWSWGQGELSGPHDATVLDSGNILVFDNGIRPDRQWSRVVEMDPLRSEIVWQYKAPDPTDFFTLSNGSCQRLTNGNTLIADSDDGRAFEVTPTGEIVWDYFCPHRNDEGQRATIVRIRRYEHAIIDSLREQYPDNGA
jgi:hypothetical protein